MSVQSEIKRINDNIKAAYASLNLKGATLPTSQVSENLESTIDSIEVADIDYNSTTKTLTITTS